MLGNAGFEVMDAADLSQKEMREKVGDFAAKVAAKGPDTCTRLPMRAHGLQIDGENFLVPGTSIRNGKPTSAAGDRLNDVLNTLTSVPARPALCCRCVPQ